MAPPGALLFTYPPLPLPHTHSKHKFLVFTGSPGLKDQPLTDLLLELFLEYVFSWAVCEYLNVCNNAHAAATILVHILFLRASLLAVHTPCWVYVMRKNALGPEKTLGTNLRVVPGGQCISPLIANSPLEGRTDAAFIRQYLSDFPVTCVFV